MYLSLLRKVFPVFILILCICIAGCGATSSSESSMVTSQTDATQTQSVEHLFGTTAIPLHPKRIASYNLEDMLLSLKAPLVLGVSVGENYYLEDRLKAQQVSILNMDSGLANLEAFADVQPDLIVASATIDRTTYDQLSLIAPTIVYDREDWKNSIVKIGKALDLEDQAQQVITDHNRQVQQAKATITEAVGDKATIAFLRTTSKDIRLYLPGYQNKQGQTLPGYAGMLYNDLGLLPMPLVYQLQKDNTDKQNVNLSTEVLPEVKADYVFVTSGSAGGTSEDLQKDQSEFAELQKSPIWQALPAVQNHHLYSVNAKYWISTGPIADELKIKDAVKQLTTSS